MAELYAAALKAAGKNSKHTLILPYEAARAMGGLSVAQALLAPQQR